MRTPILAIPSTFAVQPDPVIVTPSDAYNNLGSSDVLDFVCQLIEAASDADMEEGVAHWLISRCDKNDADDRKLLGGIIEAAKAKLEAS